MLDPDDARDVHAGVLRYGREVAFATAEVYARAAEVRGAWDARLEALVVDSVLRAEADETMLSRASALGWGDRGAVAVVLGSVHEERRETDLFDDVRRAARAAGMDALCATQGDRLVVLLGGVGDGSGNAVDDTSKAARAVLDFFGPGPVVVGPAVNDLEHAHVSARGALSAHRAAAGWPEAPRPVRADELLAERALAGDGHARRHLVEEVYLPLPQRPRHPRRDAGDLQRLGPVPRGHRAGAVLPPQHGALPPTSGRRPHRPHPDRRPRRLHPRDRPGPRPSVGTRMSEVGGAVPPAGAAPGAGSTRASSMRTSARPPWPTASRPRTRPTPRDLVADAEALLADLDDSWLRDQVVGLRTVAGRLAGEQIAYPDEVEACYGVRPARTDRAALAAAYDDLEALLPGPGSLRERYRAFEDSAPVPATTIEALMADVVEEARARTRDLFGLPDGESIEVEYVRDTPWLGYHEYLGDLRGRISINVDRPRSAISLLHLAVHETYAGHQAEACNKEVALVRGQGLLEGTIPWSPRPSRWSARDWRSSPSSCCSTAPPDRRSSRWCTTTTSSSTWCTPAPCSAPPSR